MDSLLGLYLALEETPGDNLTLMALADLYLDLGHADASACLRWTLARRRYPFLYQFGSLSVSSPSLIDGSWWWTRIIDEMSITAEWGLPSSCQLPLGIWKRLRHDFNYSPSVFKQYPSLRSAYEALFDVWPLTTSSDRNASLRGRDW